MENTGPGQCPMTGSQPTTSISTASTKAPLTVPTALTESTALSVHGTPGPMTETNNSRRKIQAPNNSNNGKIPASSCNSKILAVLEDSNILNLLFIKAE